MGGASHSVALTKYLKPQLVSICKMITSKAN